MFLKFKLLIFYSQIVEVVRQNYESLTLKILDNLDYYDRYTEVPKYSSFFTSIVRVMVKDTRQMMANKHIDFAPILITSNNASTGDRD